MDEAGRPGVTDLSGAAKILGLEPSTLQSRMARLGM
jgi:transcriptional regulator with GAF, ATPase, and Fis domain